MANSIVQSSHPITFVMNFLTTNLRATISMVAKMSITMYISIDVA